MTRTTLASEWTFLSIPLACTDADNISCTPFIPWYICTGVIDTRIYGMHTPPPDRRSTTIKDHRTLHISFIASAKTSLEEVNKSSKQGVVLHGRTVGYS